VSRARAAASAVEPAATRNAGAAIATKYGGKNVVAVTVT